MMIYKDFIKLQIENNFNLAKNIFNNNIKKYKISGSSVEAYSYIISAIQLILKIDADKTANDVVIDGHKDGCIDAIFVDTRKKIIHIFDVKKDYSFDRKDIINNFLPEFRRNFLNKHKNLSSLNNIASLKIEEARDKYFNKKYSVKIYFVRCLFNNVKKDYLDKLKNNLLQHTKDIKNVSFDFFDLNSIIKNFFEKKLKEFSTDLDFKEEESFYDSKRKVVVGKIIVKNIIDIIDRSEKENYNIFDDNVRVDQEDASLQADLKNTLKLNFDRFFLFHNGVTISCTKLKDRTPYYFTLINPQIINGCQSLKALKEICYNDADFLNSEILCRIFEGKNAEDINSVCQSTNSQRAINKWDLRTNDLIQKVIEDCLFKKGYYYNRKRKKKKESSKIHITDIAQWIHSCINYKPASAKSSKKSLFDISMGDKSEYYKKIFNPNHGIDKLSNVCNCCIKTKSYIQKDKKGKNKDYRAFLDHANLHIMAYIFYKGGFSKQHYDEAVEKCRMAVPVLRKMKDIKEYSYNNIFKSPETWGIMISKK